MIQDGFLQHLSSKTLPQMLTGLVADANAAHGWVPWLRQGPRAPGLQGGRGIIYLLVN